MKHLFRHPLFIAGLIVRLVLLALVLPRAASQWYVPFLNASLGQFTLDPWQAFLAMGGQDMAFPYGYVMWGLFLPLTKLMDLLGASTYWGYGLTLLVADIALLMILRQMLKVKDRVLLLIYWVSPITLFATYWLGFNDLIPVALLSLALYFLHQLKPVHAGVLCGAAISAKLSMLLAVPFFCIYLYGNRALRLFFFQYLISLAAVTLLLCGPFFLFTSGPQMLLHNPEIGKVFQLAVHVSESIPVFVLPMGYLLMLYLTWRVRRMNFESVAILQGMAFFLVLLLTPASAGWFIWIIPLLTFYQAVGGRLAVALVAVFTMLYIVFGFLTSPMPYLRIGGISNELVATINRIIGADSIAVLYTALLTLGGILMMRIWREAIRANSYFRISRKPFVLGIAGDSGAGKDTLAESIVGLFGNHSVVQLSGDDYHLWDRQKPMWQVMTHLNPRANDLEQYARDLLALSGGKAIQSRHYDHSSGKRSHPHKIESNDVIIASGLHALHLPILRKCYDLSIYLDIDEGLRRFFKLKRDVFQRGHKVETVLSSLQKREADSAKFIRPQAAHADLVLSLQPIHPRILDDLESDSPLRFKLHARSRHGFNEESLVRVLVGVCGLHVDMNASNDESEVELTIEGETSKEDIAMAAQTLFPQMMEFLDPNCIWKDGVQGLMQLVTLSHINQAFSKRLI